MRRIVFRGYVILLCLFYLLIGIAACRQADENTGKAIEKKPIARKHLFSVAAMGADKVWMVGFEGMIHHSKDGGESWSVQTPPVQENLYNVCFVDEQTGWIVGKKGVMFHTTNGGQEWKQLESVTENRLFDVHFINKTTGWAVGYYGTILHTEDGGVSWTDQGWGEDRYYNGVYFVDAQTGWIAGEYSTIHHTTDGGKTWKPQECKAIEPVEPPDDFPPLPASLYGIYFQSREVGWITGQDGIIIKTEDGGTNWKLLTPKNDFTLYQIAVEGDRGWAVGEKGNFMVSTDGGNTWEHDRESLRSRSWLRDIVFADAKNGWIIGAAGTIIHTTDAGKTWQGLSGGFIQ